MSNHEKTDAPPNIMSIAKRQNGVAACDWLEWTWFGSFQNPHGLCLAFAKAKASRELDETSGGLMKLGNETIRVGASSVRRGMVYKFQFEHMGIVFGLRFSPGAGPQMFVRATGQAMLVHGMAVIDVARHIAFLLRFKESHSTISRLDLCADVFDIGVPFFERARRAGRVVTRAVDYQTFWVRKKLTGCTFGNGLKLRIYDKLEEVKAKPDILAKLEMRWGGPQDEVTRVEFQLMRDKLKDLGLDSLTDLETKLPEVVSYITGDWFSVVESAVTYDNYSRAVVCAEWQSVREIFGTLFGEKPLQKPKHVQRLERGPLLQQAFGCLTSAAVLELGRVPSVKQFAEFVANAVRRYGENSVEKCRVRLKTFVCSGQLAAVMTT